MLVCVTLCQWGHRLRFSDHSQSNFACSSWPIGDQLVAKLMTTFLQVVLCMNKWMDGGCQLRPRIFLKRVCWRRHLCPINIHLFTEHCSASYRDSTGTEQTNANSFCVNEAPWLIAKLESWHWGLMIYSQIVTLTIADTSGICITKAMNRPLAALWRQLPSLGYNIISNLPLPSYHLRLQ